MVLSGVEGFKLEESGVAYELWRGGGRESVLGVLGLVVLSGIWGLIWRIEDVDEVGEDDGALRR